MYPRRLVLLALLLTGALMNACAQPAPDVADAAAGTEETVASSDVPSLAQAFEDDFLVGAALNPGQFTESDSRGAALVKKHFNTITPENVMKWENIHPDPGEYDFEMADQFVQFGEENDLFTVGHTLVWHNQTPEWVFEKADGTPVSRDTLIQRMRDHIFTVVNRYEDRVEGWDVVNEALNDDGTLRESPWLDIIGEEYLTLAFRFAHEADPDAELYYNDYSLTNPEKRKGAVRLVQNLLDQDLTVTGIGMQGHYALDYPTTEAITASIEAFSDLGVDVMISELDVAVLPRPQEQWGADITKSAELREELNPYPEAFPDSMQQALAERYTDFFEVFLDHREDISRVTFWGVTDGDSWLNGWPIAGRTTYPLLFDRQYQPKPAFHSVVEAARQH